MKILRVDMERLQVRWETVPAIYERLGGRSLIARLLLEEVPPACDALGSYNKLIFAPGLLGGRGVKNPTGGGKYSSDKDNNHAGGVGGIRGCAASAPTTEAAEPAAHRKR